MTQPANGSPEPSDQLASRLAAHAATVETYLDGLLTGRIDAAATTGAKTGSDQLVASPAPDRLREAMRHAVLSGGKRLRPFLVLESSALFGVAPRAALAVAAALECIHCYSLVHDDLPAMDNDRLRRGKPTVWAAFDDWTAILAGDALLTLAFEIIADPAAAITDASRTALTRTLSRAAGWQGMVGGQVIDLEADKLGTPATPDEAHVRRLQSLKTGALILFASEAGAILADAPAAEREALARYGRALGLAFQIADDILDAEGDAEIVGKATGKDADAGKATLIALLGIEAARRERDAAHREAIAALAGFGPEADMLRRVADFVVTRDR